MLIYVLGDILSVPNIEKLLQYLQCVSIKPIQFGNYIESDKIKLDLTIGDQITDIRLNSKFFYNDSCQMCGGCDPAESNVYTQSEYEIIQSCIEEEFETAGLNSEYLIKLREGLYKESYHINGKVINTYIYKQEENELYLPTREKIIPRCTWCFQDSEKRFKCRIHPVESITCIMPHLRIFHVKGSNKSSIGISQFGRNWALKCPVILTPPDTEDQFEYNKQNRVSKLQKLNQCGLDLNIETYLPQVISYVEKCTFDNYQQFLNLNTLQEKHIQRKLF